MLGSSLELFVFATQRGRLVPAAGALLPLIPAWRTRRALDVAIPHVHPGPHVAKQALKNFETIVIWLCFVPNPPMILKHGVGFKISSKASERLLKPALRR